MHSEDGPSLAVLAHRAKSDEQCAIDALLTAYWPTAYRIAFSILSHHHLAEDAAQDACARILVALPQLRDDAAFPSWARRIVVHAACAGLRASLRELPGLPLGECKALDPSPADQVSLQDALHALSPMYRVPLVLHHVHGLTSAEIGRELGVAAATIRSRLVVARERLRQQLEDPGGPRPSLVRKGAHP